MLTVTITFNNTLGLFEAQCNGGATFRFKGLPEGAPVALANALVLERHIVQLQTRSMETEGTYLNAEELAAALAAFESRGGRTQLCGPVPKRPLTPLSLDDLDLD